MFECDYMVVHKKMKITGMLIGFLLGICAAQAYPLFFENSRFSFSDMEYINMTGSWTVDGLNISLMDTVYCNPRDAVFYGRDAIDYGEFLGCCIHSTDSIEIKTGRSLSHIRTICNHEMCHVMSNLDESQYLLEEKMCREIENVLNHPTCNKFIEILKSTDV